MQSQDVYDAAQHTYSILRWASSFEPMSEEELHDAFDSIYDHDNPLNRVFLPADTYYAKKAIAYESVKLAYSHFFGEDVDLPSIRKFLFDAGK